MTQNGKGIIIRHGRIYIHARVNNRLYRFSTKLRYTKENLQYISDNFHKILDDHIKGTRGSIYSLDSVGQIGEEQFKIRFSQELTKELGGDAIMLHKIIKFWGKFYLSNDFFESFDKKPFHKTPLSDILEKIQERYKAQSINSYLGIKNRSKIINTYFKHKIIQELKSSEIDAFITYLINERYAKSTITAILSLLKYALRVAYDDGLLDKIPNISCRTIRSKTKERNKNPFNLQEISKILQASKKYSLDFQTYLKVAFFTGMRTGEILALRQNTINFQGKTITVKDTATATGFTGTTKTLKARVIDALPPVLEAIRELIDKTGKQEFIFFQKAENHKKTINRFRKHWNEILQYLKLEHRSLYTTRHTFASIMLQQGEESMWVGCKMLGHSTLNTTFNTYAKYIEENKERAQFIQGLGEKTIETYKGETQC